MINRPQDYRTDRVGKGFLTVPNTKGNSFILPYFRFMCGLTGSLQYNINNMYMPNYRLDPISTYQLMCQSKNDNYSMI